MMHHATFEEAHAVDVTTVTVTNQLLSLIYGRFAGNAACLAARLGIPDLLYSGRETTAALAESLHANPSSLTRFLKALSSCGLLVELEGDRWTLTPAGNLLRGDVDGSLRDLARLFATPEHTRSWLALEHSVRTATPAFDHVFGTDAWSHAVEHPAWNNAFNSAMSSIAGAVHKAIASVYDFSSVSCLVDVGGGHGRLLATIARRFQNVRGIVFDMPHVVEGARKYLAEVGLSDRCEAMGGDFFESLPAADAYIMTAILHDWNDEKCISILRNCRRAMRPGGRVLIGDFVLKSANQPDFGRLIDLEMLLMTHSGRERTESEFRELLTQSGLLLAKVIPLPSGNSLLEAVPV